MTSDDIYQKIGEALCRNTDYQFVDTENGIALIGESVDDVWLIVVNKAKLEVSAT